MRITEGQLRRIIREEIELQEMGGQRLMQTQVEYIYQLADGSWVDEHGHGVPTPPAGTLDIPMGGKVPQGGDWASMTMDPETYPKEPRRTDSLLAAKKKGSSLGATKMATRTRALPPQV